MLLPGVHTIKGCYMEGQTNFTCRKKAERRTTIVNKLGHLALLAGLLILLPAPTSVSLAQSSFPALLTDASVPTESLLSWQHCQTAGCVLDGMGPNRVWRQEEKNVARAVLIEWIVPIAGHAYAGNWAKGLLPTIPRVGGAVLLITSTGDSVDLDGRTAAGLMVLAGGTLWAMISAAHTAKKFNAAQLEKNLSFSPTVDPKSQGVGVGLTFSF